MSLIPADSVKAGALDTVEAMCRGAGWKTERVAFGDDAEILARIPSEEAGEIASNYDDLE